MVPSQNVNIENMVKFGGFVPHGDTKLIPLNGMEAYTVG